MVGVLCLPAADWVAAAAATVEVEVELGSWPPGNENEVSWLRCEAGAGDDAKPSRARAGGGSVAAFSEQNGSIRRRREPDA